MFYGAGAFNGDLSQWNVAKVTTMDNSKSILILENDLIFSRRFGLMHGDDVKMVERWC